MADYGSDSCQILHEGETREYWVKQLEASAKTLQKISEIGAGDLSILIPPIITNANAFPDNDGVVFFFDFYHRQPRNTDCNFYLRTGIGSPDTTRPVGAFTENCDSLSLDYLLAFQDALDSRYALLSAGIERYYLAQYPEGFLPETYKGATPSNIAVTAAQLPEKLLKSAPAWWLSRYSTKVVNFPVVASAELPADASLKTIAAAYQDSDENWQSLWETNAYAVGDPFKVPAGTNLVLPAPLTGEWQGYPTFEGQNVDELAVKVAVDMYHNKAFSSFTRWLIDKASLKGRPNSYQFPIFKSDQQLMPEPILLVERKG